jgi:hypothetical protein
MWSIIYALYNTDAMKFISNAINIKPINTKPEQLEFFLWVIALEHSWISSVVYNI